MHSELLLSLVQVGAVGVLPGLDGHERDQHGTGLHRTGSHVSESKLVKYSGIFHRSKGLLFIVLVSFTVLVFRFIH